MSKILIETFSHFSVLRVVELDNKQLIIERRIGQDDWSEIHVTHGEIASLDIAKALMDLGKAQAKEIVRLQALVETSKDNV